MRIVKDKIMYQATTRDYKVGDVIEFGKTRNFQAERVYNKTFKMYNGESAGMFLLNKVKEKKRLTLKEMKELSTLCFDYDYVLRELGIENCRKKINENLPSRLSGMFLCDNFEDAKCYISTAKGKGKGIPKVVSVKLNGRLHKSSNNYNKRDGNSIDGYTKKAKQYWKGVGSDYKDPSCEYLFEGIATIVDVFEM